MEHLNHIKKNNNNQIKMPKKVAKMVDYFVDKATEGISNYFSHCTPYEIWIFQSIGNNFSDEIGLAYYDFLDLYDRLGLISGRDMKRLLSAIDEVKSRTIKNLVGKMADKAKPWGFGNMACFYLTSEDSEKFFSNRLATDCFVITATTERDLNVGDKLGSWVVTKKSDDGTRVVVKNNKAIPIPLKKWFWTKHKNGMRLHWIHIPSHVDLDVAKMCELVLL